MNVPDSMSKPYCFGLPAITVGEGLTKALKAREPLSSPLYGNVNAHVDCTGQSVFDICLHPLGSPIRSVTCGISESPGVSQLYTLRFSPLNRSPSEWVFYN